MWRTGAGNNRGSRMCVREGRGVCRRCERTREELFNTREGGRLPLDLSGARVLDRLAGCGALGLEALSRGAAQVVFVENGTAALAALRANIAKLRAAGIAQICETDATHFVERSAAPADLVLMDPPYGSGLWAEALDAIGLRGWIGPAPVDRKSP